MFLLQPYIQFFSLNQTVGQRERVRAYWRPAKAPSTKQPGQRLLIFLQFLFRLDGLILIRPKSQEPLSFGLCYIHTLIHSPVFLSLSSCFGLHGVRATVCCNQGALFAPQHSKFSTLFFSLLTLYLASEVEVEHVEL